MQDFTTVAGWLRGEWMTMFNILIRRNQWNFLFYTAMLPAFLMLCFDIIMSIICSVRLRELRFFNVLSPRSWALYRSSSAAVANHVRDGGFRFYRISSLGIKIFTKLGIMKPKTKTVFKYDKDGKGVVVHMPSYGSPEWHKQHNDFVTQHPIVAAYERPEASSFVVPKASTYLSDSERRQMSKKHPSINIEVDDN